ncbi:MAG TPA: hypothetical protein VFC25_14675 [Verrucomicrobiae bacterium]|nr:hypothetical protein [Verrucomicrobiae bacterium]
MLNDLRYACRLLFRSPLFTATAVLSLAIGIGATTTVFTLADALLFRAADGVADPARVVDIGRTREGREFDNSSYPDFQDLAQRATTLSGVYGARLDPTSVALGGRQRGGAGLRDARQRQLFPGAGCAPSGGSAPHAGR